MASIAEIHRRFELAPELPSGLRNKISTNSRAQAGAMSGSLDQDYYRVQVQGKQYYTTHIVAMLADLPRWRELREHIKAGGSSLVIDHIDGNTLNNAPSNLRITSNRENVIAALRAKGKQVGASFCNADSAWRSFITDPDTGMNIALGTHDTEEDAHRVYLEKARKLYPMDNNEIRNN
ncbi:HNH endonuclease [Vibrio alginolyticus]